MELLLNLLWLSLALLVLGLRWRRGTAARSIRRLDELVLLSCALILLFPVVSATDDLHPLRPDMEECNPSKKLKRAAEKSSCTLSTAGALPAQLAAWLPTLAHNNACGQISFEQTFAPKQAPLSTDAGRAPPSSPACS
jgi:hypothetical protein